VGPGYIDSFVLFPVSGRGYITVAETTFAASQALASTPPHFASVRFLGRPAGRPRALAEEDGVLRPFCNFGALTTEFTT
jgi:hypothetical protein